MIEFRISFLNFSSKKIFPWVAFILFFGGAVLAGVAVSAQEVTEYQDRLIKLSKEIAALKKKIKEEDKKKSSILSELDKIGFNKKLIQKEIALYNIQMKKANQELTAIQKKIPPLKAKLDEEKQSVEKILVTLYKYGRTTSLEYILHIEDISNLITESKQLTFLAKYQENIVSNYLNILSELQAAENSLETKEQEIAQLITKAHQKRRDLTAQERKSRAIIREIEENKKTHLQALEELQWQKEQLQLLIEKLQRKEISLPYHLVPLYEKKGKLPWPTEGKILTKFGLQRHPRFNTVTMNNGIEIASNENSLITAIHAGTVVYCDYFQGYGNLIILDHGMTYYSLYGHCSNFLVEKGDFVEAGQPIAIAGDSSSLVGTALYFEIRFKTKPLNPLQWLRR